MFSFAGVFTEIVAMWRANRDLLVRVASVFFFLPGLASYLFLMPGPVTVDMPEPGAKLTPEQQLQAVMDAYAKLAPLLPAYLLISIMALIGSALIFVLLLAPERPTLAKALERTALLVPGLMLIWLLMSALTFLGAMAFIVPGLYVIGRTLIAVPVLAAEPRLGPIRAFAEAIHRTRRRGWLLFLLYMLFVAGGWVLESLPAGLLPMVQQGTILSVPVDALVAAFGAAGMLAMALLQAALYRLLPPSKGM